MRKHGCLKGAVRGALGFTLVELMIAMTLGLGLMTLMVGTIDNIQRASRISAEATEAVERGYFVMDAMDHWVAETSPLPFELGLSVNTAVEASTLADTDPAGRFSLITPATRTTSAERESAFVELNLDALEELLASGAFEGDLHSIDPCQNPTMGALPLAIAGIGVLEPTGWPCIPQSHLEVSAPALLFERRLPCHGTCNDAGFYVAPLFCIEDQQSGDSKFKTDNSGDAYSADVYLAGASSEGAEFESDDFFGDLGAVSESELGELLEHEVVWLAAGKDRHYCFANGTARSLHRSLVYVRNYSWRVGDGISAVMVRELAREPEARWLRSSMLAHGIEGWQIDCVLGCVEVGGLGGGALLAGAIDLRFTVDSRAQSIVIQRALAPRIP